MADTGTCADVDPFAQLTELANTGAQQFDPIRFRYLEALAERTRQSHEHVQLHLINRLQSAITEYLARWDGAGHNATKIQAPPCPAPSSTGMDSLRALVADLQAVRPVPNQVVSSLAMPKNEMQSVRQFRQIWSRIDAERRLSQAVVLRPENAGPLNSHKLALQSLLQMHDTSPAYLQRFLTHLDTLLYFERDWTNPEQTARTSREPKTKARR